MIKNGKNLTVLSMQNDILIESSLMTNKYEIMNEANKETSKRVHCLLSL